MSNFSKFFVSVNTGTKIKLSTYSDTVCPGSTVVINARVTDGNGGPYFTYFPNGSYVPFPLTIYPDSSKNYVVYARDTCGSIGVDTLRIVVLPYPPMTFTSDIISGCEPLTVHFNEPNTDNGHSYEWDFGDGTIEVLDKQPVHTYPDYGIYTVRLKYISSHGCLFTYRHNSMITVYRKPIAGFGAFPGFTTVDNPDILFKNNSLNADYFLWSFGTGDSSNIESPTYRYKVPGVYEVKLIASTLFGCIDTMVSSVIIGDIYTFYAPNVISPNSDNVNDVFNVFGNGMDPDNFHLYIYDRWGEIIYETKDLKKGWNGMYRNSIMVGSYTWLVKYTDLDGVDHTKSGIVTVIK